MEEPLREKVQTAVVFAPRAIADHIAKLRLLAQPALEMGPAKMEEVRRERFSREIVHVTAARDTAVLIAKSWSLALQAPLEPPVKTEGLSQAPLQQATAVAYARKGIAAVCARLSDVERTPARMEPSALTPPQALRVIVGPPDMKEPLVPTILMTAP